MNNLQQLHKSVNFLINNPNNLELQEKTTVALSSLKEELNHIEFQSVLIDSVLIELMSTYNDLKGASYVDTKARLENRTKLNSLETFIIDLTKVFQADLKGFYEFQALGDKIYKYTNSNKNFIFSIYGSSHSLMKATLRPPSLQKGKVELSYKLIKSYLNTLLVNDENYEFDKNVIQRYYNNCKALSINLDRISNSNKDNNLTIKHQKELIDKLIEYITQNFPIALKEPSKELPKTHEPNPYPEIFTSTEAYKVFNEFIGTITTKTQLADYSFIYRIMLQEGHIIKSLGDSDYRRFLDEKFEIAIGKTKTLDRSSTAMKEAFYKIIKEQYQLN